MDTRIEQQQVRVKLTDDPETIAQLLANKRLVVRKDGKYEYTVTFDSMPITIVSGTALQLGHSAAQSLIAVSYVVVGDHLTGVQMPALIEAGSFSISEATAENICEYCAKEFEGKNVKQQKARHLSTCEEFAKLLDEDEAPAKPPARPAAPAAHSTPAEPTARPAPTSALKLAQAKLAEAKASTTPPAAENGEGNDAA